MGTRFRLFCQVFFLWGTLRPSGLHSLFQQISSIAFGFMHIYTIEYGLTEV